MPRHCWYFQRLDTCQIPGKYFQATHLCHFFHLFTAIAVSELCCWHLGFHVDEAFASHQYIRKLKVSKTGQLSTNLPSLLRLLTLFLLSCQICIEKFCPHSYQQNSVEAGVLSLGLNEHLGAKTQSATGILHVWILQGIFWCHGRVKNESSVSILLIVWLQQGRD